MSAASWKMGGSSRRSFTSFDFWVFAFVPQNCEVFGCSWRPYVEIFSTTRSRCQGRGARRVTACHSQCLRTGPRPAYLSAHPPSPPTMAPGMIRMTRIQSFRGRSHNPPPPLFFSPALFVSLFLDCVIGNLPHPPISLVHAHYLLLLSIIEVISCIHAILWFTVCKRC